MSSRESGGSDSAEWGHFDLPAFLDRVQEDREFVFELVQMFLEICDSRMRDIRSALEEGDRSGTRDAAHKLKGSLKFIHATKAAKTVEQLEQIDPASRTELAIATFSKLETEIAHLCDELARFSVSAVDR